MTMKIQMFGESGCEAILLLPPMFTDSHFFDCAIAQLSKNYRVIVPTYSGHYIGSTYQSIETEEEALDAFLRIQQIPKLKVVAGFSLGGNIAFHYFCRYPDRIGELVVDSAPMFRFPRPVKQYFYGRYAACLAEVRRDSAHSAEILDRQFHGMGRSQQQVAPLVTDASLKNLVESCYGALLPRLDASRQRKITFVYGTRDIARLCLPRVMRYRHSRIVRLRGRDHCEGFRCDPAGYIDTFLL